MQNAIFDNIWSTQTRGHTLIYRSFECTILYNLLLIPGHWLLVSFVVASLFHFCIQLKFTERSYNNSLLTCFIRPCSKISDLWFLHKRRSTHCTRLGWFLKKNIGPIFYWYREFRSWIVRGRSHVGSKLDRSEIDLSSLWESVHTHLDRSWIDLSSHLSVHIQVALDLNRSEIDLTH